MKTIRNGFAFAFLMAAPITGISSSHAQGVGSTATHHFDIPSGPLNEALRRFAALSGIKLIYPAALAEGFASPGVAGDLAARDALTALLAGTPLYAQFVDEQTVTLDGAGPAKRELGPVRIEGTDEGRGYNGSTDVTATEGTGSYTTDQTTVGSKIPLSLQETPQAISVVTQQFMRDRNLNDLYSVLDQTPGVSLIRDNGLTNTIVSRGWEIKNFQIDGGPVFSFDPGNAGPGIGGNSGYTPLFDMGEFDHVELLRGSDGQWAGTGDPSGTINLTRKRPLSHDQVTFEGDGGSWDNFRGMADVTGPLTQDGRLRGRLVLSGETQDYFYKIADKKEYLAYATLEYDLTPSTLLTAGGSWTRVSAIVNATGLPRYESGADLPLSRDTCLCFPWSTDVATNYEWFAKASQQIGSHWTAAFDATGIEFHTDAALGGVGGFVIPSTLTGPIVQGDGSNTSTGHQYAFEVLINGEFTLFGQPQKVTIGANRTTNGRTNDTFGYDTGASPTYQFVDIFHFNPANYPQPPRSDPNGDTVYSGLGQNQTGYYSSLLLTPVKDLHILVGTRYNKTEYQFDNGANQSVKSFFTDPGKFIPYASVMYDVTNNLTPYFSYTQIYQPQPFYSAGPAPPASAATDSNGFYYGQFPPGKPLTGADYEVGIKGSFFEKKLTAALNVFRMDRFNQPVSNFSNGYYLTSDYAQSCCFFFTGETQTKGVELETAGEVAPGVQLRVSYTFSKTEEKQPIDAAVGGLWDGPGPGQNNFPQSPDHLFKLWANWFLGGNEKHPEIWWRRLSVGAGVNAQSKTYFSGSVCPVTEIDNKGNCKVDQVPYNFTQGFYPVVSARLGYEINRNAALQFNVNNVMDRTYWVTPGDSNGGNWYGDPRNFMITVNAKF